MQSQTVQKVQSAPPWIGPAFLLLAALTFVLLPGSTIEKFYMVCFGICPQRPSHSYYLGGAGQPVDAALVRAVPALEKIIPQEPTKLPVEARMYGMFAGFMVTWLFAFAIGRGRAALMPPAWLMLFYLSFVAVMGIDGINATLRDLNVMGLAVPYAYEPRLELRLATGLLCGIAIAGIVLPIANYVLWNNARAQSLVSKPRELTAVLLLNALVFGLVLTRSGLLFYPLALLAVVGVLATIVSINVVLVLSLARREGFALTWFDALNPIAIALFSTLIELGILSLVRFAAFGAGEIPL